MLKCQKEHYLGSVGMTQMLLEGKLPEKSVVCLTQQIKY